VSGAEREAVAGELRGIPATGRDFRVPMIAIF